MILTKQLEKKKDLFLLRAIRWILNTQHHFIGSVSYLLKRHRMKEPGSDGNLNVMF